VDAHQHDSQSRASHFSEREQIQINPERYVIFFETVEAIPDPSNVKKGRFNVFSTHQLVVREVPGPYFHLIDFSEPPVLPVPMANGVNRSQ
jgi:hypothetical protein